MQVNSETILNSELNSGAYCLTLNIKKDTRIIVGAIGICNFQKGIYIYTGSAMKNLRQRVARHLRLNKSKDKSKIHWHIDYLTTNKNTEIIKTEFFPSIKIEECKINANLLKLENVCIPIVGFGSSDCKKCKSHLIKIK
jgi:Uri superfamily endonuclease